MELAMDAQQQQLHRQLEKALNQDDKELVEIILNQHAARQQLSYPKVEKGCPVDRGHPCGS
jgi:succinate dehydrogenase flavin-adding protein (antitoxin of CptAB toxin-antitoxin module)